MLNILDSIQSFLRQLRVQYVAVDACAAKKMRGKKKRQKGSARRRKYLNCEFPKKLQKNNEFRIDLFAMFLNEIFKYLFLECLVRCLLSIEFNFKEILRLIK